MADAAVLLPVGSMHSEDGVDPSISGQPETAAEEHGEVVTAPVSAGGDDEQQQQDEDEDEEEEEEEEEGDEGAAGGRATAHDALPSPSQAEEAEEAETAGDDECAEMSEGTEQGPSQSAPEPSQTLYIKGIMDKIRKSGTSGGLLLVVVLLLLLPSPGLYRDEQNGRGEMSRQLAGSHFFVLLFSSM